MKQTAEEKLIEFWSKNYEAQRKKTDEILEMSNLITTKLHESIALKNKELRLCYERIYELKKILDKAKKLFVDGMIEPDFIEQIEQHLLKDENYYEIADTQ